MPLNRLSQALATQVAALEEAGTAKGSESVVVEVRPAEGDHGPRFFLQGEGP